MKRILILLLTLSLTSCAYIGATEEILISSPPTEHTASLSDDPNGAWGSAQPSTEGSVTNTQSLVINTNTKKIHYYDTCGYLSNTKDENKEVVLYDQLSSLLAEGYSVCSRCEKQNGKT